MSAQLYRRTTRGERMKTVSVRHQWCHPADTGSRLRIDRFAGSRDVQRRDTEDAFARAAWAVKGYRPVLKSLLQESIPRFHLHRRSTTVLKSLSAHAMMPLHSFVVWSKYAAMFELGRMRAPPIDQSEKHRSSRSAVSMLFWASCWFQRWQTKQVVWRHTGKVSFASHWQSHLVCQLHWSLPIKCLYG